MIADNIQLAKEKIKNADAILITAGAGMGVDSGLPDFRGNEGFWEAYPPIKKLGLSFSQMANPQWFESKPYLAWAFYGHRLNLYRDTIPHNGFIMLQELVKEKSLKYFIFTSNVDGQFQKAGFSEDNIYECHGSIHHLQCTQNCTDELWENNEDIEIDMDSFQAKELISCPNCGVIARPNILMFGDWAWNSKRSHIQDSNFQAFIDTIRDKNLSIVIIEIGAGEAVPTVRHLSEEVAQVLNGFLIRINPRDYDTPSNLGVGLPFGGLEGIKRILDEKL